MEREKLEEILRENWDSAAEILLELPHWPQELETMSQYARYGDDTRLGRIHVVFSPDSDGWVEVWEHKDPNEYTGSQRFRTGLGGGESPRVRNALLLLALAIKKDNEEHPQQRGGGREDA